MPDFFFVGFELIEIHHLEQLLVHDLLFGRLNKEKISVLSPVVTQYGPRLLNLTSIEIRMYYK